MQIRSSATATSLRRSDGLAPAFFLGLVGCFSAAFLDAQVIPYGPEVQVNTYTTGQQDSPQLVMAADGSFAVFWCCGYVEAEGRRAIVGQRFDSGGSPLGPEFVVNEHSLDYPAAAAVEGDGEMVVVWGDGSPGCPPCSADFVKGRRIGADGAPLGAQFEIGTPPGGAYTGDASVAAHESGGFVVAWYDYGVLARRYDPAGLPLGDEFSVAVAASSPAVASRPGSGFVVAWCENEGEWIGAVHGRLYGGDGVPTGEPIQIASESYVVAGDPVVASVSDGSFVVAWEKSPIHPGDSAIEARRFDSAGAPLAPARQVNARVGGQLTRHEIAVHEDGRFAVVWLTLDADPAVRGAFARRFDTDGVPLGLEFLVETEASEFTNDPEIAIAPSGDLVAVWSSWQSFGTDQDGSSIQLRRFRVPFFIDGFESGDAGRWSAGFPRPAP